MDEGDRADLIRLADPDSSVRMRVPDGVPCRGVRDQRLGVRGRLPGAHFHG